MLGMELRAPSSTRTEMYRGGGMAVAPPADKGHRCDEGEPLQCYLPGYNQSSTAQIKLVKKSTITKKQTHRSVSTFVSLKSTDLSTGSR